jgi:hypothetical protein
MLMAAFVGASIAGGLFYTLNTGLSINQISSAKALACSQARRVCDWISRDLRQAVVWDLANNNPSATHIKFRPVLGWDITGNTYQLDVDYIEYSYDANTHTLTRNQLNNASVVLKSWVFNNVTAQPFFMRDSFGNLIALDNSIGTSKKVIVVLSVQNQASNGLSFNASLTSEIKIRNE